MSADDPTWEPCATCNGDGQIETGQIVADGGLVSWLYEECADCSGTGDGTPLRVRVPTSRADG